MTRGLIMDATRLTLDPDWIIATASSGRDGRNRWTEINVYVLPDDEAQRLGTRRRFIAEVLAKSSLHGERTKTRRVAAGTLERALDWIDDSDLGMAVKVTAREFAIEQDEDRAKTPELVIKRCTTPGFNRRFSFRVGDGVWDTAATIGEALDCAFSDLVDATPRNADARLNVILEGVGNAEAA